MKNWTKRKLEKAYKESGGYSESDVLEHLDFTLRQMYRDKTRRLRDEVVCGLTFEELIGVLLDAKSLLGRQLEYDESVALVEILHPPGP
ncbi:MAG: hypothetical protein HWN51_01750 [Desulfobacterales bacterium]|nr:hypothetical protein [Desulfobacterales bacterium]